MTAHLGDLLDEILAQAGASTALRYEDLGIQLSWEVFNAAAAEWAKHYKFDLVQGLTDSTHRQLGETIARWIESDEDFADLVERARRIVPPAAVPGLRDRAELVAATEVTRIYADSQFAGAQAAGLTGLRWTTAADEIVCPICSALGRANDGQGALADVRTKKFLNPENGQYYEMPGHPGCRCWARSDVSELQALADQQAQSAPQPVAPITRPIRRTKPVLSKRPESTPLQPAADVMGYTWFRGELPSVVEARAIGEGPNGWAKHERVFKDEYLPKHKVKDDVERTIGLWGAPEPSFNARVRGSRKNVLALAKDWGRDYNQDAMALLLPQSGGKGGALAWDFGKALNNEELDRLLGAVQAANQKLAEILPLGSPLAGFTVGLTVKGDQRVEFWVSNDEERDLGQNLLEDAIAAAGLGPPAHTWSGGYEFKLLFRGTDY